MVSRRPRILMRHLFPGLLLRSIKADMWSRITKGKVYSVVRYNGSWTVVDDRGGRFFMFWNDINMEFEMAEGPW